jgi:hypothetical protein
VSSPVITGSGDKCILIGATVVVEVPQSLVASTLNLNAFRCPSGVLTPHEEVK